MAIFENILALKCRVNETALVVIYILKLINIIKV